MTDNSNTGANKSGRKTARIGQRVANLTVDADLLPKTGGRKSVAAADAINGQRASIRVYAPVSPAAAALQRKVQHRNISSTAKRIDAAIEAGNVPPADAKKIVLNQFIHRSGNRETAEKWYRSEHIATLGNKTPAQLVRAGELKALLTFINGK